MPKHTLTSAFCAAAACDPWKRKTDYYDKTITGFVLEVRSSGGRSYYLRYQDPHGKQKQHRIAGYGDITFAQAKARAQTLRSEIVLGGDPAVRKAKRKAVPLYAELARQHLDSARNHHRRPGDIEGTMRNHLVPAFGKLRLDEITQQAVAKWLADKRKVLAPATVEKLRVTLHRSYRLAKQWNIPGSEINPVEGVPRPKFSNARERFLSAEEVQRLFKACDRTSNPQLRSIVALLLYTGARKRELLDAQWQHVDVERKAWFIPDSKSGKSRYVPLSGPALAVIDELVRIPGCPYLVPNPLTLKPYRDIKRAWDAARRKAGLPCVRIHDLRHSAASFMINAGVDLYAVGRVLGHADHQSTMRYAHLANDTLMAAVEAGAASLQGGGR